MQKYFCRLSVRACVRACVCVNAYTCINRADMYISKYLNIFFQHE